MQVECHDNLERPLRLAASRVLVADDLGNPLALFIQLGQDHVRMVTIKDPDFNQTLEELGIYRTVVLTTVQVPRLKKPIIKG